MISSEDPILVSSQLDLFEEKPIFRSFIQTREIEIFPNDGWLNSNVINFQVPVYNSLMYEADSFSIEAEWEILNGDGTKPTGSTDFIAPVCGVGICGFEYISTEIGQTLISGEHKNDNYRFYIEQRLGHSALAKNSWMSQQTIWFEDDAGLFNATALTGTGVNKAFKKRYAIFTGNAVETFAPLPMPLAQAKKLLIPGINMRFSLKRASSKFLLLTNKPEKNPKIQLNSIKITARARAVEPEIMNKLTERLQQSPARYPFLRTSSWSTQLSQETLTHRIRMYQDFAPEVVYICFVRVDAYQGSYSLNPFELKRPKIESAYISVEGNKFPQFPYSESYWGPDENESQARKPYIELFRILQQRGGIDNGLTFKEWIQGTFILAIQVGETLPSAAYSVERRKGDTLLNLEFSEKPDEALQLIALAQFQSNIFVTATSGVIKTYVV